jgi:hypothetical protein
MSNAVQVTTDQTLYEPGATLRIAITNASVEAVRVADHQSDCTAVCVEAWDGRAWAPCHPCRLMRPTRLHTIAPGTTLAQAVRPPTEGAASGWPPGAYRATCVYLADPDGAEGTAHSAPFTIG